MYEYDEIEPTEDTQEIIDRLNLWGDNKFKDIGDRENPEELKNIVGCVQMEIMRLYRVIHSQLKGFIDSKYSFYNHAYRTEADLEEIFVDSFFKTIVSAVKKYDKEKGNLKFYNFYVNGIRNTFKDEIKKVYKEEKNTISINNMMERDEIDIGVGKWDLITENNSDFEDELFMFLNMHQFVSTDIEAMGINEAKRAKYDKIFFTSYMVFVYKDSDKIFLKDREKELYEAMNIELLDYTYKEYPEIIESMMVNKLKKYKDIFKYKENSKSDKELDTPFGEDVLASFLNVSTANISKQLNRYRDNYKNQIMEILTRA